MTARDLTLSRVQCHPKPESGAWVVLGARDKRQSHMIWPWVWWGDGTCWWLGPVETVAWPRCTEWDPHTWVGVLQLFLQELDC